MIDVAAFVRRLNRTKTIPLKVTNALTDGLRLNSFDAQETFLSPGNYPGSLYFIQNGLVRGAIEGQTEKITTWFKQEGDLILPEGLFNQQPSEEYISAIAKTTLLSIPAKHLQSVIDAFPETMVLIILLLSERNREGQYREKLLRIPAAKDRYACLSANESFILRRVPHYLIASYLNVTKETFSRLHKGLAY